MMPAELAWHWDCLIAAHVMAGDEVGDIAREFGIYPVTVVTVVRYLNHQTLRGWRQKLARGGAL